MQVAYGWRNVVRAQRHAVPVHEVLRAQVDATTTAEPLNLRVNARSVGSELFAITYPIQQPLAKVWRHFPSMLFAVVEIAKEGLIVSYVVQVFEFMRGRKDVGPQNLRRVRPASAAPIKVGLLFHKRINL